MKIYRSTKLSFKFATEHKRNIFKKVLEEYGAVVNFFIHCFWENVPAKRELLKPVVDLPETWLSFTLKQIAAREAIDMIKAVKERDGESIPKHRARKMQITSKVASLEMAKSTSNFDMWLHLSCVGNHIILDFPIKLTKHYNRLELRGKRLNSYILTRNYLQLCFEIETGAKKEEGTALGIDTGIKTLATLSTGKKLGCDIENILMRINRCKHGSKHQRRLRRYLKHRMDGVCKEIFEIFDSDLRLLVVEKLKNMNKKTKLKRRLGKNMRRVVGSWAYRYWLSRLQERSEDNRVVFRSVPAYNTSILCPACGLIDKKNRPSQGKFLCQECGHADDADINAARNILARFLSGPYGAGFKNCAMGVA